MTACNLLFVCACAGACACAQETVCDEPTLPRGQSCHLTRIQVWRREFVCATLIRLRVFGSRLATWCQKLGCHGEEQCMAQASSASTAKGCARCPVGLGKLGGGGVACARRPSGSRRSASRRAWCPTGKRCASAAGVASGRRSTSSSGRSASGQAGCASDTCCAAAAEFRVSSGVAAHGAYPLGSGRLVSA